LISITLSNITPQTPKLNGSASGTQGKFCRKTSSKRYHNIVVISERQGLAHGRGGGGGKRNFYVTAYIPRREQYATKTGKRTFHALAEKKGWPDTP
jgi:DNA/RNA endonuclease G (NUC1)